MLSQLFKVIKEAKRLLKLFLVRAGFSGIILLPFGIYILKERIEEEFLRLHELVHLEQCQK